MINFKNNQQAFSLIEALVYVFITTMLLTTISSLVLANFNIRKQLKTSDLVFNDARFIMSQLANKIHTAASFVDLRPDPKQIIFDAKLGNNFIFILEDNDLFYQEILAEGQDPVGEDIFNSAQVQVSDFILTPVLNTQTNHQGVLINFTLSIGAVEDIYGYLREDFQTFITIR
ncbi:MAG: hypothetical protein UR94_C0019G0004 [Parcubacteria group bacterium GW2011_GWA2_36_10]|nr:MAG: hypothetical protein UR94_C0019G0004 [Parcubacteria group bacterium GW2011_GWA2_36_10]